MALAEHCLMPHLVWFIHNRKMVIHMMDDVKDLSKLAAVPLPVTGLMADDASTLVPLGLVSMAAEKARLWAIALQTVITLVSCLCWHGTTDLLHDFEMANGYAIWFHALEQSTMLHGVELVALLPLLVCCWAGPASEVMGSPDGLPSMPSLSTSSRLSVDSATQQHLALNLAALDVMEDLLWCCNPLLHAYCQNLHSKEQTPAPLQASLALPGASKPTNDACGLLNDNERPVFPNDLPALAYMSLQIAWQQFSSTATAKANADNDTTASVTNPYLFALWDVAYKLLSATLQLFSSHPQNYASLEERMQILTFSILALPCFPQANIRYLILKMLEVILTAVGTIVVFAVLAAVDMHCMMPLFKNCVYYGRRSVHVFIGLVRKQPNTFLCLSDCYRGQRRQNH